MANNKSLKYFIRPTEPEVVTAPAPDSFRDDDGNVIQMEIKVLSQKRINEINSNYLHRTIVTDKKGNPLVRNGEVIWKSEKDSNKITNHIIAESLQYPNLCDKELMDAYNCYDITEMPNLVFRRPDEYAHVLNAVMVALGLLEADDEQDVERAKN